MGSCASISGSSRPFADIRAQVIPEPDGTNGRPCFKLTSLAFQSRQDLKDANPETSNPHLCDVSAARDQQRTADSNPGLVPVEKMDSFHDVAVACDTAKVESKQPDSRITTAGGLAEAKRFFTGRKDHVHLPHDKNGWLVEPFIINEDVIPEPKSAASLESFSYRPDAITVQMGRGIAPFGATHDQHIRNLERQLLQIENHPSDFQMHVAIARIRASRSNSASMSIR